MSAQTATGCNGICHLLYMEVSKNFSPFPCLTFDHLLHVLIVNKVIIMYYERNTYRSRVNIFNGKLIATLSTQHSNIVRYF